jgi:hypothetical protein
MDNARDVVLQQYSHLLTVCVAVASVLVGRKVHQLLLCEHLQNVGLKAQITIANADLECKLCWQLLRTPRNGTVCFSVISHQLCCKTSEMHYTDSAGRLWQMAIENTYRSILSKRTVAPAVPTQYSSIQRAQGAGAMAVTEMLSAPGNSACLLPPMR